MKLEGLILDKSDIIGEVKKTVRHRANVHSRQS